MANFVTNGASELPDVKSDSRASIGATTEWAAADANDLRQAALDLRDAIIALQALVRSGSGSPEGSVTATVGAIYLRTNGGADTTLYVKESGSGNTGWVAK